MPLGHPAEGPVTTKVRVESSVHYKVQGTKMIASKLSANHTIGKPILLVLTVVGNNDF